MPVERPSVPVKEVTPEFLHYFLFDFPAFDNAIATACFCGLPAAISVFMFSLITLRLDPLFKGMLGNRHYEPDSSRRAPAISASP
jgi:hypothetical protein